MSLLNTEEFYMLEFAIGIIIGAIFSDFWKYIYSILKTGFNQWKEKRE